MAIKLTKREYLGEGYSYTIRDIRTGELITTLCTKEQYDAHDFPEVLEGFEYVESQGGFPLIDNSTGKKDDCFMKGGEWYVYEIDSTLNNIVTLNRYSEEEFNSKYIWQ